MIPVSMVTKDRLEFDPIIPEDERRFYQKAYPNVNLVRERKVHCTVCKMHIGTAPSNESIIRMHPILRVTHCKKCHEFYNSGEFSKGEDGSELYCRWCGQGGEVYCCSNCPFVFCKSCIISNLSRGVVADIEQNENWSCFNCAPKMLWPLRAQHWALMKFIDKQKKAIINSNLTDAEIKIQMTKDRSLCCKVKKATGYGTDSSESSDISLSKMKQKPGEKRPRKTLSKEDISCRMSPALPKRPKPNDEVVCTPDVMSMLEPECQLTVAPNTKTNQPTASSPKIMSIPQPLKRVSPPPLIIRNAQPPPVRPTAPSAVVKKTIVGPRLPATTGADFSTPVYHTINGYRIDLNSAAQQETVRLPNGKLIQVKRQGTGPQAVTTVQSAPSQPATPARVIHNAVAPSFPNQQIVHSSGGHIIRAQLQTPRSITVQNSVIPQFQQQTPQQFQQITIRQPNQSIATIRYQGASNQQVTNIIQNGTVQLLNGAAVTTSTGQVAAVRQVPTFIKQIFPNTPLGLTRNQLQNQICSAMEICQHLMNKVQTLTNSNAYKTAKSLTDVKELYIHLSYLLTYAIGRFKGLQDNCLSDMRELGFTTDANSLENGQLAAGTELVRTGQITDFVSTGLSSFHVLVMQNLGEMITAAADSSTTDGTPNDTVEENEEVQSIVIDDCDENNEVETDLEIVEWPQKDVAEDDDDCFLIESGTDNEIIDDSDDDLLIECGEREPDDCESPQVVDDGNSNDGISDNENDISRGKVSLMGGFTHDLDTKLIELVKENPALWDSSHPSYLKVHQSKAWKQIEGSMPIGLNCRMRWKNIRYRYLNAQKRSSISQSSKQAPPHRNAFLLKFLDKVSPKPQTVTRQSVITPDEHDTIAKLIGIVEKYPTLWHPKSLALIRHTAQPEVWKQVLDELQDDSYKQASDAEEDEITIVEPKTDTITLDSDNEDESSTSGPRSNGSAQQSVIKNHNGKASPLVNPVHTSLPSQSPLVTPTTTTNENNEITTQFDFSNILAGMFDVDLSEPGNNGVQQPKKPRKKTTNKPNPTLLKQKEIQERERLENLKKNDAKLKMQVQIPLNKVEEIYQYAKPLVDELKNEKLDGKSELKDENEAEIVEKKSEAKEEIELKIDSNDETTAKDDAKEVIKKDEVESMRDGDEKDDAEEVVVLVVEDMENSKEDESSKNGVEDTDESIEIIERDESQDPEEDQGKEDSQPSEDSLKDNESKKREADEKPKEKVDEKSKVVKEIKESEKEKDYVKTPSVLEVIRKISKDKNTVDTEENTPEDVEMTNEDGDNERQKEAPDVKTDTLKDESIDPLTLPGESHSVGKGKEIKDSDSSSNSPNTLCFKRILSQTGAV